MTTYTTKPRTVEAVRYQPGNPAPLDPQPAWLFNAVFEGRIYRHGDPGSGLLIDGSDDRILPGDWIVLEAGVIRAVSDDEFNRIYQPLQPLDWRSV